MGEGGWGELQFESKSCLLVDFLLARGRSACSSEVFDWMRLTHIIEGNLLYSKSTR